MKHGPIISSCEKHLRQTRNLEAAICVTTLGCGIAFEAVDSHLFALASGLICGWVLVSFLKTSRMLALQIRMDALFAECAQAKCLTQREHYLEQAEAVLREMEKL